MILFFSIKFIRDFEQIFRLEACRVFTELGKYSPKVLRIKS